MPPSERAAGVAAVALECLSLGSGALERRETVARERRLLGLWEVVDEVLQAGLREHGLFQVDQRQRFLEERRRHLLAARIVRHHSPELRHCLLERLARLVPLILARVPTCEAVVRLADPVLRVARELMLGKATEELAESRDREGVAAFAEVEVGRLVDVLRLKRAGRRAESRRCGRGAGCRARSGRGARRRRHARTELAVERLDAGVELIDATSQGRERG